MKKILALLLTLAMLFSLAACGGGSDDKTPSSDDKTPSSSQQQEDKTPEADPDPVEDESEDTTAPDEGGNNGAPVSWPENEWTAVIPKAADTVINYEEGNSSGIPYFAIYLDWTDEEALAYGQKLVDAGFPSTTDDISDGQFTYEGGPDGYLMQIAEQGETEDDYMIVLFKIGG